jgi:hypothetical protein
VDGKEIDLGDPKLSEHIEAAQKKAAAPKRVLVHQFDQPASAERFVQAIRVRSQADPRIEELVKQAEAIKPGSGAEIRKALEAVPKAGKEKADAGKDSKRVTFVAPKVPGVRLWEGADGKKVIILSIHDGKVQQLSEADVRKFLDKAIRVGDVDLEKNNAVWKAHVIDWVQKANKDKVSDTKPAPPTPANWEALSRQIERLTAELRDLRKRVEDGKK